MKITDKLFGFIRSITFRLTIATTFIILFFVHLGMAVAIYRTEAYLTRLHRAYLQHFTSSDCPGIDATIIKALPLDSRQATALLRKALNSPDTHIPEMAHFSVVDLRSGKKVVFQAGQELPLETLKGKPALTDGLTYEIVDKKDTKMIIATRTVIQNGKPVAWFRVASQLPSFQGMLISRARAAAGLMMGIFLSSLLISFILVYFLTNSIRKVVSHVQDMDRGGPLKDLHIDTRDEAGAMAGALNKMNKRLNESYIGTLGTLARLLETKDRVTETHSMRVVHYAMELGKSVGLSDQDMMDLEYGALLHDIGKVGVDDGILRKTGPLSEDEWQVIRQHPTIGYSVLKNLEFLRNSLPVILHHQERFDGRGYPNGLKGEQIPILARIFTIADAFEAMVSDRPYRKAMKPEVAVQEIRRNAGTQFDPRLAELFVKLFEEGKIHVGETHPLHTANNN
jgi:HD-GYP domain-containing protein (c-di-GMP phosphodiesterase class II)